MHLTPFTAILLLSMGISVVSAILGSRFSKRTCYHCSSLHDCNGGTCYGDYCVKVTAGSRYVSKGCENKTTNVYVRSTSDRQDPDSMSSDVGCIDSDTMGVPSVVCYCKNADFCNAAPVSSAFSPLAQLLAFVTLAFAHR